MKIRYTLCVVCVFVVSSLPTTSTSFAEHGPRMRIYPKKATSKPDMLMLPSNATSIRENITDNFSCDNRTYGYYADVENECQIFHVCLPVTYSDGRNKTFKWSFICPEETIFNQEVFVCVREEDSSIPCEDSEDYYSLNENFGGKEEQDTENPMEGNSNVQNDKEPMQDGSSDNQIEAADDKTDERIKRRRRPDKITRNGKSREEI